MRRHFKNLLAGSVFSIVTAALLALAGAAQPPASQKKSSDPVLVDELGKMPNGPLKAKLDAYFAELLSHSDNRGVIFISGPTLADYNLTANVINGYISMRKFDPNRIEIGRIGKSAERSIQFWRIPPGAARPRVPAGMTDPNRLVMIGSSEHKPSATPKRPTTKPNNDLVPPPPPPPVKKKPKGID